MSGSDPDDRPIFGRDREIAVFAGLLADLDAGSGRCALIEGEAGIGKTALLDAVLVRARAAGFVVVHGACHESGRGRPVQVLLEALGLDTGREPSRAGPGDAVDTAATAVERVLSEVDLRCSDGPLVLATDDLHRADEASLLLWQRLCRSAGSSALLLVATCRRGASRPELERLRQIVRSQRGVMLTVPELSDRAALDLAGRVLGAAPGPRLAKRLEPAGGNPFYLRGMLEALVRAGAVAIESGTAELTDPAGGPATRAAATGPERTAPLAEVVSARLDFLSETARELLLSAALLGPEFAVTDLSELLGRSAGALTAPVQEAVAAGVLEPSGSRLRFRYGLLRQSLYESVPAPERARLHRAAIKALIDGGAPVERVAELIIGVEAVGVREAEWAAQHAKSLCRRAPDVAARLFEHVLAHAAADGDDRDALIDELAVAGFSLGRYERMVALCREILDATDDPRRRGPAAWILAYSLASTGRLRQAEAVVEDALREPGTTALWRARLLACAAMIAVGNGRYGEARDAASHARTEGELLSDGMAVGYALYAEASLSLLASDLQGSVDAAARALISIESKPELTDLKLMLYANQIAALTGLDQFAEAEMALRTARTLGQRAGSSRPNRYLLPAARLAYHRGRWDDALEMLGRVAADSHGIRDDAPAHEIRVLIKAHRDEAESGARYPKAPPGDIPQAPSERLDSAYALLADAVLNERFDQRKQALATLARALEPAYVGLENSVLLLPSLVRLAVDLGDRTLAELAVRFADGQAGSGAPRHAATVAQWCRGLLAEDRAAVAGAASYFRSVGRGPEFGHALEDTVVLSSAAGRADAVRDELAAALTVYADLGAAWDIRRMTGRLRRCGVRVSGPGASRPSAGWAALTDTERRIAPLVGEGRSNPEIAAMLLLSRRTIETHVSRILAKLGVRSRRDVAGLSREEEREPGHERAHAITRG